MLASAAFDVTAIRNLSLLPLRALYVMRRALLVIFWGLDGAGRDRI